MAKNKKQKKGRYYANLGDATKNVAEATTISISEQLKKFKESEDNGINKFLI
jgi:hypothetical protein